MDTISTSQSGTLPVSVVTVTDMGNSAISQPVDSGSKWISPILTSFEKWGVQANPNTNTNKWGDVNNTAKTDGRVPTTDSRGKWGELTAGITGGNTMYWIMGGAVLLLIVVVILKKSGKKK